MHYILFLFFNINTLASEICYKNEIYFRPWTIILDFHKLQVDRSIHDYLCFINNKFCFMPLSKEENRHKTGVIGLNRQPSSLD